MNRLLLAALLLAALPARAFDDEKPFNNYTETEADRARKTFTEAEEPLPPYPEAAAKWFDIYLSPTAKTKLLIAAASVRPAADGTVRYIANVRSPQGFDNISAEALYCAPGSFAGGQSKKSGYKTYAYGDPVNRRWITARNPGWQEFGGSPNSGAALRGALYRIWCIDGTPDTADGLIKRLNERGGLHDASGRQSSRESDF
ncbi:CNP1-like family [Kingella potus]|uniref:CNP1-like family n=1 Tax=Kingella potus TaxID=265175 RepID=A0A377R1I4_9NEIS|nr:CNP1-like family protein [Kingella potus]UOP00958.1 CNP1-like family protein [Kingella potus]STR00618.1 CNP1-like family [Kingella potus]